MVNFSDEPRRESVIFFEQILARHAKVFTYQELDNFVYELLLENGTKYLVWLTNKYTVSINDVVEKLA